jgi:hypothetical protein
MRPEPGLDSRNWRQWPSILSGASEVQRRVISEHASIATRHVNDPLDRTSPRP